MHGAGGLAGYHRLLPAVWVLALLYVFVMGHAAHCQRHDSLGTGHQHSSRVQPSQVHPAAQLPPGAGGAGSHAVAPSMIVAAEDGDAELKGSHAHPVCVTAPASAACMSAVGVLVIPDGYHDETGAGVTGGTRWFPSPARTAAVTDRSSVLRI